MHARTDTLETVREARQKERDIQELSRELRGDSDGSPDQFANRLSWLEAGWLDQGQIQFSEQEGGNGGRYLHLTWCLVFMIS